MRKVLLVPHSRNEKTVMCLKKQNGELDPLGLSPEPEIYYKGV